MLTKFDVHSSRVKGISFHRSRPWVLCGLHNGTAQIWDYCMNVSVDTYTEHNGSVRGVDFHNTQPLFVTGADDNLIKVWNYKLRRCLFTLTGHVDYIRVTFFHHQQPWIISSSDDFTVRIWNWQSRTSVASLTGHDHYVMCAQFHPREDLVVSASLDRTIRVWDISALRTQRQETGIAQDLLGNPNVVVKYLLEGHEKGVNWVCFHPTKPYIASAADDRTVRVWRMSETSCHEELQLRGHTNNVNCVSYIKDYLISNGEDRTIRVWDVRARCSIMVFRRDTDRYWILATLPARNLIAAGHDSGMMVFKLFRERPAWALKDKDLYYVYENKFYSHNLETDVCSKYGLAPHLYPPRIITCNPVDNTVALWFAEDGGMTEVLTIPRPGTAMDSDGRRHGGVSDAVFFAPNKYMALDRDGRLLVCGTQSEREKLAPTERTFKRLFPAPVGNVVCHTDNSVELYHFAQNAFTYEAPLSGVRYVVWDKAFSKVAFIGQNCITVMTKQLKTIAIVTEPTTRVKGAVFDDQRNILYYTTSNQLKYCSLRTSECGTIQSLAMPVYPVKACGDTVMALSRDGKLVRMELNNVELDFKLKLQQQAFRDVIRIIRQRQLKGQALVGYLHKHGYSEIALHFVTDPLTRFNLAIECGAMEIARNSAVELNQVNVWRRLAEAATTFGDISLAEFAHSKSGNYHGAGLLSVILGNTNALSQLVSSTKDDSFNLHYGLYLNDTEKRVKVLEKAGQLPLAYLAAKSGGLNDLASDLLERMDPQVAENIQQTEVKSFEPPHANAVTDNWPMLEVEESVFARLLKESHQQGNAGGSMDEYEDAEAGSGWDEDGDDIGGRAERLGCDGTGSVDHAAGEGWDDDLEILEYGNERHGSCGPYIVPTEKPPLDSLWVESSSVVAVHVAAGSFATAFSLLRTQIGLANPEPLKPYMMGLWVSVNAARPAWLIPSALFSLTSLRSDNLEDACPSPLLPNYLPQINDELRAGYAAFVEGRFADSHVRFVSAMHQAVVAAFRDDRDVTELLDVVKTASEYTRALNVQLHCKKVDGNSTEALELSLYFTHFKLQRNHLILALSQAMSKAYKKKNFKTAGLVARRLLDQDPPASKANQATAIVAEADRNPTDAESIEYNGRNPFELCSVTHRPIYRGTVEPARCGYCFSPAFPDHKGELCPVCTISIIGAKSSGLCHRI
ncbi:WD domain [Trypanosoma vivax]|uniref:Coatomer subunit alpha n=1 Tax=Trypanosoma vivax (strain Y486) TaxID=1055687 RepID=G0TTS0_TRYVY|nr:putative coatomer alpha subunit [Trypanosoma vivax]KAH8613673.1 WD domain [Trypanosoma vivax]CCC47351.1 putative coatomer alpha subunit [Trypanosoma vivax Y486]